MDTPLPGSRHRTRVSNSQPEEAELRQDPMLGFRLIMSHIIFSVSYFFREIT